METNHFFVKNNATSRKKLRDIRQRTISNSGSLVKIETIPAG